MEFLWVFPTWTQLTAVHLLENSCSFASDVFAMNHRWILTATICFESRECFSTELYVKQLKYSLTCAPCKWICNCRPDLNYEAFRAAGNLVLFKIGQRNQFKHINMTYLMFPPLFLIICYKVKGSFNKDLCSVGLNALLNFCNYNLNRIYLNAFK